MNKQIITTVIDAVAEKFAGHIAIESPNDRISYRDLKDLTDHLAACLLTLPAVKGKIIGIYLPSSIQYIAGILAINKAGALFMPLEMEYPAARLQYLLQEASPAYIITGRVDGQAVPVPGADPSGPYEIIEFAQVEGVWKFYLHDKELKPAKEAVIPVSDGNDGNYVIYTSGSTGTPKIIEGRNKSLSHFVHWEIGEFGLDQHVRCCQFAPLSFDVSLRDIFVPLVAGGCIVIPSKEDKVQPRRFLDWLDRKKITLLHIVPAYFRELTREINESNKNKVASLQYILLAGEPLYKRDVTNWYNNVGHTAELVNLYGPSETTLAKIFHRVGHLNGDAQEIMPLGQPISNTSIAIINHNQLCNIGEIGEIHIKTPFMTKGYLNDADLTRSKFIQNPLHNNFEDIVYKTGDLGKYLPDKSIAFVGRTDSQVKIRGNRVELAEVTVTIQRYPGIKHAEVIALDQPETGLRLCCYYTADEAVDTDALRQYLTGILPEYMHPSYFVNLPQFPLNLNGKIDKKSLPRPEEMLYEQFEYDAPAGDLEEKMAEIWEEVLGLKKAGVNNSFFQLGGHSLTATRIVSGIFRKLNRTISLKDFFENPTIRKICTLIREREQTMFAPIPRVGYRELYEASFAQKRIHLLDRRSKGLTAYNMPVAIRISGQVDVKAIEASFRKLVERHEILRTTFTDREGTVYQQVHPLAEFSVTHTDARQESFQMQTARSYIEEGLHTVFDLEKGPLLNARIVEFRDKEFLLVFVIHHIVCDGWSMRVITRDFLHFYKAFLTGGQPDLPELSIQYKDYTYWLNERIANDQNGREFWRDQLMQEIPPLNLPFDFPRPAVQNYAGETLAMRLDHDLSDRIRRVCMTEEISPFVFFQSIFKLLLYKLSGQTDILLGTPVAGRNHPELEQQAGLFLNYVVLRTAIVPEESFRSFLHAVKKNVYDCFEHTDYPFDKLAEEFAGGGQDGRNPFYDILFVMNNAGLNGSKSDVEELGRLLNMQWIPVFDTISKVDLSFFVNEEDDFTINTEYRTDLLLPTTVQHFIDDLVLLLREATDNEDLSVAELIGRISGQGELEWLRDNKRLINEDF